MPEAKPVIFLTFANDKDGRFLEALKPEQNGINQTLASFQKDGGIVFNSGSSKEEILKGLNQFTSQLTIFHFSGHSDGKGLQLEAPEDEQLEGKSLVEILREEVKLDPKLKLIFLNACNTKGILKHLQEIGVPAVILTTSEILDNAAKKFSIAFYRSLTSGNNLQTAFAQAKSLIESKNKSLPIYRSLTWDESEDDGVRVPWGLYIQDERILNWKLRNQDPLDDLPKIPDKYYQKLPKEPFINLRPFVRKHSAIFFGRGQEIASMYKKIQGSHAIILLYGQSGVGKSSFLDAGLLPRMEEEYDSIYVRRGNRGILRDLMEVLEVETPEGIKDAWIKKEKMASKPLVIFIDQVEEAFTRQSIPAASQELEEFLGMLSFLFDEREDKLLGKIVLSFRKEYLPEIEDLAYRFDLAFTKFFLKRLDKRGIVEAIGGINVHPSTQEAYGLSILEREEEELAKLIADDLLEDTESALAPILQILLSRMWEANERREFSVELYQKLKKEGYLLQDFFDLQLKQLKEKLPEIVETGFALDLLFSYTTSLGTAGSLSDAVLKEKYPHLAKELDRALPEMEDLYLITSNEKALRSLSHDTLAPIIQREHKNSDKVGQRAFRILESKHLNSLNNHSLLDEIDLKTVEEGRRGMRRWREEEISLVKESQAVRERKRKRNQLIKNLAILAAVTILSISAIAIFFGLESNLRERKTKALLLVADSRENFGENPRLSVRLAEAAYAIDSVQPDPKVSANLVASYYNHLKQKQFFPATIFQHRDEVIGAEFGKLGQKVLTWSKDGHTKLWDRRGNLLADFPQDVAIKGATFNPSANKVLTWSESSKAMLWAVDGSLLAELSHKANLQGGMFNRRGDKIISWSLDSTARLWNLRGNQLAEFRQQGIINELVLNKEEDKILSWGTDTSAILWDLAGNPLSKFSHKKGLAGATFSNGGDNILTWGYDDRAIFWDLNGNKLAEFSHRKWVVNTAVFNKNDDKVLLTFGLPISRIKTAILWDLETDKQIELQHDAFVSRAIFNDAEDKILTCSHDKYLRLWNLDGSLIKKFPHDESVMGAKFNEKEDLILSWSNNMAWFEDGGNAYLWKPSGKLIAKLPHKAKVKGASFNKEENELFTWSADGTCKLWDISGNLLAEFIHGDALNGAMYSDDESYMLSWSADSSARLWDLNEKYLVKLSLNDSVYGNTNSFFINSDKQILVCGERIRLWNSSGEFVKDFDSGRESDDEILGTVVSDQGRYIVSWSKGDELSLWNNTGDLIQQFSIDKRIRSAVFNKDGNKILAWTGDGAYIWDINGTLLQEFSLREDALRVAMFNSTEDKILTLADDGKSILWSLEGERLAEFTHTDKQSIRRKRAMFTQNSERIVSWGPDSMIKFWDYSGGLIEYIQQEEAAEEIIFNSKEDYMLSWRENRARLWNLHSSQSKSLAHNDYIKGAIFNGEGDKILIWSNDDKARLWNLEGIMIAEFQHSGATDGIHGAIFNEEENKILTYSSDFRSKLWDIDGNLLAEYIHPDIGFGGVIGASFDKEQNRLLTTTLTEVNLWYTPKGLFQYLRRAPIAPLSTQEKKKYEVQIFYKQ